MIEVCFFHMGCYRNICLWFKIVFPLAGSIARYMSPVHIQPNVTISGIVCSSYQEHQIASPRWCFTVLFADFSVGMHVLQRKDIEAFSIQYKLSTLEYIFLETHNNTWINGFLKLFLMHLYPYSSYRPLWFRIKIGDFLGWGRLLSFDFVCMWMRKTDL